MSCVTWPPCSKKAELSEESRKELNDSALICMVSTEGCGVECLSKMARSSERGIFDCK